MKKLMRLFSLSVLSLMMGLWLTVPVNADDQVAPSEITYICENEVLEKYSLTRSQFEEMEIFLFGSENRVKRAFGDFPSRTSTSYSSFAVGDITSAAGAIGTIMGYGFAPWTTLVGLAMKMSGYGTVYTTRHYTQRRTNGVLYVRNEVIFYSNASRTNRITNWIVNREYSDNGLD